MSATNRTPATQERVSPVRPISRLELTIVLTLAAAYIGICSFLFLPDWLNHPDYREMLIWTFIAPPFLGSLLAAAVAKFLRVRWPSAIAALLAGAIIGTVGEVVFARYLQTVGGAQIMLIVVMVGPPGAFGLGLVSTTIYLIVAAVASKKRRGAEAGES